MQKYLGKFFCLIAALYVATFCMVAQADLLSRAKVLAEMRASLRPYWVPMESGGIFLLAGMDEYKNEQAFNRLMTKFPQAAGKIPELQQTVFAETLASICADFFQNGKLEPGTYQLDNYHLSYANKGQLIFDSNRSRPTPLPKDAKINFKLTSAHLDLMRSMNTRDWENMVELMDPKRPYGDATYYYLDMASALDEPITYDANKHAKFSPASIKRYTQLHREMIFAVQAFWQYAKMP